MTSIQRPVRRETAVLYRGRPLLVELAPRHLTIREKGRRDRVSVDFAAIYEFAMKIRFRREQAEKKQASASRRGRA